MWVTVVIGTETPITVKSSVAFMRIVISVASSMMSISVSIVTIIEVVLTESNRVSIVRLSFIAVMSTVLVGAPAAVVRKVATIVLSGVWLRVSFFEHSSVIWAVWLSVFLDLVSVVSAILVCSPTAVIWEVTSIVLSRVWLGISFFKHCSVIWAVWLPVRLLLNSVEVKRLCEMPLALVMVVNIVMSITVMVWVRVDDVVIHVEVGVVNMGVIVMVIMVVIVMGWLMPVCEWVVISVVHLGSFNIMVFDSVLCFGCNIMEEFIVLMLHVSFELLTMMEFNITWVVVTMVVVRHTVVDGEWCGADRSGEDSNDVKGSHIQLRLIIISLYLFKY